MTLREAPREKLYVSIAQRILEGIQSRRYPPGRALPAERALAEELGVGRGSLREAIRVLEQAGVLDVRMGSGTYVAEGSDSIVARMRVVAVERGEASPLDIIVARRAVEPTCAALAATGAHPGELAELNELIADQAMRIAEGRDPADVDLEFHLVIGRAARNPVLSGLLENIVEVMRQSFWSDLKRRSVRYPGERDRYLNQHRAILRRIEARDPAGAARLMRQHVDSIEKSLLGEVS